MNISPRLSKICSTELSVSGCDSSAFFQPLLTIQAAALDLYHRRLNVFPVPSVFEWQYYNELHPDPSGRYQKPPYLYKILLTTRLHVCGPECDERTRKSGRACLAESARFDALFYHANLAIMMGRTSGNLFAFECDTRQAFECIGQELCTAGFPFWAFTSHRGGSYVIRLAEGEAANNPNYTEDIQIWGNGHYLVFPPSIHPTGTIYQWITPEPYYHLPFGEPPPLVTLAQVEALGVHLVIEKGGDWQDPDLYGLPEWGGSLSRKNRQALAMGVKEPGRQNAIYRVCRDMAGCEIPRETAERYILAMADKCNPPYSHREAIQRVDDAYKRNNTPARKGKAPGCQPWERAITWAALHAWKGRTAQTDRVVFLACCERARMQGGETFRASTREIAEIASCTRKTATGALRRLSGRVGTSNFCTPVCLRLLTRNDQSGANVYSFNMQSISTPLYSPCSYSGVDIEVQDRALPTTEAEQDLFGRLGKLAWRAWQHLQRKPEPSKAALSRALHANPSSIKYVLDRLMTHGLVTFNGADDYYFGEAKTGAELEHIAAALHSDSRPVIGRSAKRKRTHERDRERRANVLLMKERERWHTRWLHWSHN